MCNLSELQAAVNAGEEYEEGDEATIFLHLMGDIEKLCYLIGIQVHTATVRNQIAGALGNLLVYTCKLYGCYNTVPKVPEIADPNYDLAPRSLELALMVLGMAPEIAIRPEKATVKFAGDIMEAIAAIAVDNGFTFEQIVTIAKGKVRAS